MLRPCRMVRHRVESWRVVFGKGGVGVLAMQTLLEAVDPVVCELEEGQEWGGRDLHRLPVEATFVRDAAAMRELGEINGVRKLFEAGKVFFKAGSVNGEGGENETAWCEMALDAAILGTCQRRRPDCFGVLPSLLQI